MNKSEQQLNNFIDSIVGVRKFELSLHPQGGHTMIEKEPINLCKVKTDDNNVYLFGGISEGFYDEMVERMFKKDDRDQ